MEPIEHRLREAPLSRPSAAHDAAMQRIFAEAALRRPGFWALNVSMWQLVMACCICLAFGYLLHAYVEPQSESGPATSTVYVIPPDPALRGVFDTTPRRG